jgi:hypothetical protein
LLGVESLETDSVVVGEYSFPMEKRRRALKSAG